MQRTLRFTLTADQHLSALESTPSQAALLAQVRKALGFLEVNPPHPGLHAHEFTSLTGVNGEKLFEAYAQNNTPGAYRIFWHYGPDEIKGNQSVPIITIVAITSHP
jgi:hypothetical protein